jgi:ubiquinone/menaquinone biosynthesis C-methylase UbiE
MPGSDGVFAGAIPENYDRYMVPMIFEPYARDLAHRVAALSPHDVLETAAGTGVLTRLIAAQLPAGGRFVVTDLNQPMLKFARQQMPADPRVEWAQADAQDLPFPDGSFDLVCCQFGAMFFPDRVRAYREARRVLRPDAQLLFAVWDRIEQNEFAAEVEDALAELFPKDPPRFMSRTPHGYYDVELIRAELGAAGFASVTVSVVGAESRAPSARTAATAYCQGTPLRAEIEARDPGGLARATDRASAALAARFGDGEIVGRIRAYVVSAAG